MSLVEVGENEAVYLNMSESEVRFMSVYIDLYVGFAPLSMLYLIFVVFCACIAVRLNIRRKSKSVRVILWILGCSFCAFIVQVTSWANMVRNWEGKGPECNVAPRFATSAYVLSNIFCYLFLLERAKATNSAVSLKYSNLRTNKLLLVLKWITYWSPIMVILPFVLVYGQAVSMPQVAGPKAYCVIVLEAYVGVLFVVLDTTVSIGYLIVFIHPVLKIMRSARGNSREDSGASIMRKMIRTNLKASVIAVLTTFVMLTWITVGYANDEPGGWLMLFWTWSYPLASIDTTINVAMMTSITNIWIPKRIRRMVKRLQGLGGKVVALTSPSAKESSQSGFSRTGGAQTNQVAFQAMERDSSMELCESFFNDSSFEQGANVLQEQSSSRTSSRSTRTMTIEL